jgi:single-stranded-DNA-specific exonuclease
MSALVHRRTENPQLELPDSLHPLLQKIYRQRNIASADELRLDFKSLLSPASLKGMEGAIDLLWQALQQQQRVLVVADFDADGATSCALVMTALQQMGFHHLDYIVPNRFEYGYGLTPEIVELAATRNPDLIITVDNGISSIDGVAAANVKGIKTLVTDHHLPGIIAPEADAIVNPNQHGCEFSSKSIAGVGVIFYVMLALRGKLREESWFEKQNIAEPNMADLLDLVALGTVADVVALDRNNRILVSEGIKRIRAGRTRPGIQNLLKLAKKNPQQIMASDLGFSVGPRLNAAGRLDDMSTGIECLLAQHEGDAHTLALQLDGMNRDRKEIEAGMREQAFEILKNLSIDEQNVPEALCLFDERWHQGVVGIIASRIKEKYNRPVIVFARATDELDSDTGQYTLKGSGRSIKGFHIRDALDAVASKNPGLVTKFGGHAMAAGLSLDEDSFPEFVAAFQKEAAEHLDDDLLQARILSDGELLAENFTMDVASHLLGAGPWGQEFPEPVFDGRFNLLQQRRLGDNHLKMVLSPLDAPQLSIDAIAFSVEEVVWPAQEAREIELVYRLDINEFRGRQSLQLMVEQVLSSR